MPYFTIAIPMFNRQRHIGRAVASCLRQSDPDFELIVVDDGSTDGSVAAVEAIGDPRIRLIRHTANRGVGPARNSAMREAKGAWVISLDSDDELVDEALRLMRARLENLPSDIEAVWFGSRFDNGATAPEPPEPAQSWDYLGYLRYMERSFGGRRDMIRVARRSAEPVALYPESQMLEELFLYDFARVYRSQFFPDIIRLYHQDADNQLVRRVSRFDRTRDLAFTQARVDGLAQVLSSHGAALAIEAPRVHREYLARLTVLAFFTGRSGEGIRRGFQMVRLTPLSLRAWVVLCVGALSPRALRYLQSLRWHRASRDEFVG